MEQILTHSSTDACSPISNSYSDSRLPEESIQHPLDFGVPDINCRHDFSEHSVMHTALYYMVMCRNKLVCLCGCGCGCGCLCGCGHAFFCLLVRPRKFKKFLIIRTCGVIIFTLGPLRIANQQKTARSLNLLQEPKLETTRVN